MLESHRVAPRILLVLPSGAPLDSHSENRRVGGEGRSLLGLLADTGKKKSF